MPIGYSQEGYRPTTALANLTTQGIGPIDVTRGGSIRYAPLAAISIPSSQPELVAQGISSGIQSLASGISSGITAKWQSDKALELEREKQQTLLGQKAEERIFELDKQRANAVAEASQYADAEQRIAAFDKAQKPVREGVLARLPSGFVKKEDEAKTETTKVPAQDFVHPIPVPPQTTEVVEAPLPVKDDQKPDFTAPVAEMQFTPALPATKVEEAKTSAQVSGVDFNKYKPPVMPVETKFAIPSDAQNRANDLNAQLEKEGNKDWEFQVKQGEKGYTNIVLTNVRDQRIKDEMAMAKESRESKAAAQAPEWSPQQVAVYDKLYSNVQQNPLIKNAIDAKSSKQLVETSLKENTGFGDIAAINAFQRMVDPGVAVREGDINLMQQAIPRLEKMGLNIQGWFVGDRLTKKGRSEMLSMANNLASSRISSGSQAIQDLRTSSKNAGIDPDLIVRPLDSDQKPQESEQIKSQTESKYKLGQIAENKATGEKLQWDGTKWVPVK